MKINSLIRYHIEKLRNLYLDEAKEYLSNNGFKMIGSGCESVVYSKKGFEYVIKLNYCPFSNTGIHVDIPSDKHFAKYLTFTTSFGHLIIQEKCEVLKYRDRNITNFKKFRKWVEAKYSVSDIHFENVGVINGRFLVIDYTLA